MNVVASVTASPLAPNCLTLTAPDIILIHRPVTTDVTFIIVPPLSVAVDVESDARARPAEDPLLPGDFFQPRELSRCHGSLGFAHAVIGGEAVEPAPFGTVAALVAPLLKKRSETLVARAHHATVAACDVL